MNTADIRKVVDLMTPGCWAKTTHDERIVPIADRLGISCFQYGFQFNDFWYAEQAEACRKKYITAEVKRISKKLKVIK